MSIGSAKQTSAAGIILCLSLLAGCTRTIVVPPPAPKPHYQLGGAYQLDGYWFYPAEDYGLDATGIASVQPAGSKGLTADGEAIDDGALTAAMQTLQLPAIVTITNLQNGLQTSLRVNDRGPADPARLIALSPRAAMLLRVPAGQAALVRVQIDGVTSRQLTEQLGGGPSLQIATAARGAVTAQDLPPPGGTAQPGVSRQIGLAVVHETAPRIPDRLPDVLRRVPVFAGQIYLRAGSFGRLRYAEERAEQLSGLGSDVLNSREGRTTVYTVRAGPFASIAAADQAMETARRRGVLDARLTVE